MEGSTRCQDLFQLMCGPSLLTIAAGALPALLWFLLVVGFWLVENSKISGEDHRAARLLQETHELHEKIRTLDHNIQTLQESSLENIQTWSYRQILSGIHSQLTKLAELSDMSVDYIHHGTPTQPHTEQNFFSITETSVGIHGNFFNYLKFRRDLFMYFDLMEILSEEILKKDTEITVKIHLAFYQFEETEF